MAGADAVLNSPCRWVPVTAVKLGDGVCRGSAIPTTGTISRRRFRRSAASQRGAGVSFANETAYCTSMGLSRLRAGTRQAVASSIPWIESGFRWSSQAGCNVAAVLPRFARAGGRYNLVPVEEDCER